MKVRNKNLAGFTLMEILVSTTIFAIVAVALLSLFNYVLKINRKTEALRQSSQGMRNFVELLVKEIRNGQIDYYVANGATYTNSIAGAPCQRPAGNVGGAVTGVKTYNFKENKLGIINTENQQICFYLADSQPSPVYAGSGVFSGNGVSGSPVKNLMMAKSGVATSQTLNPPNFSVKKLMFLIRPVCDPYTLGPSSSPAGPGCSDYASSYPRIQPSVTMFIQFEVTLPTKEVVPIYYQTTVSSNKYDIPSP